jgi:hypothetical protein
LQKYDIGLTGGDFSTSENGLSVSVSLLGRCPKGRAWTRGGAKPGDVLLVTGELGGSLASGKHWSFDPRLNVAKKVRELCPDGVHACIDITDGLSRDLWHICHESKCGARIVEMQIPLSPNETFQHALQDGEDFELLLAVEPASAPAILRILNEGPAKSIITQIGEVMPAVSRRHDHYHRRARSSTPRHRIRTPCLSASPSKPNPFAKPKRSANVWPARSSTSRDRKGASSFCFPANSAPAKLPFVRGMLRGLDAPPDVRVTSPTYVLQHIYTGGRARCTISTRTVSPAARMNSPRVVCWNVLTTGARLSASNGRRNSSALSCRRTA